MDEALMGNLRFRSFWQRIYKLPESFDFDSTPVWILSGPMYVAFYTAVGITIFNRSLIVNSVFISLGIAIMSIDLLIVTIPRIWQHDYARVIRVQPLVWTLAIILFRLGVLDFGLVFTSLLLFPAFRFAMTEGRFNLLYVLLLTLVVELVTLLPLIPTSSHAKYVVMFVPVSFSLAAALVFFSWRSLRSRSRSWKSALEEREETRDESLVLTEQIVAGQEELRYKQQLMDSVWIGLVEEAIIALDREGIVTEWNSVGLQMFGFKKREIIGMKFEHLVSDEHLKESIKVVMQERRPLTYSSDWIGSNGLTLPVAVNVSAMRGIDNEIVGVSLRVTDLTEQRRLVQKLSEVNQSRNEFMVLMAHDIRSPAASINGFATLLLDGWASTSDETKTQYLEIIVRNTNLLNSLVEDIVETARIEFDGISFDNSAFDVGSMARMVVAQMMQDNELFIGVLVAPKTPLRVFADVHRQEEILRNLISNALKFSSAGSEVRVKLTKARTFVKVSVIDNGVGISETDQAKIFKKGYRIEQSEGREVEGTGFGLYICKMLVEAQGGEISCLSETGTGSTFSYTIPMAS